MIFVQVAFITDWFAGKNLNFALGVTNSLPLTGEILDAYISPKIYETHIDDLKEEKKFCGDKCFHGYGLTFYVGMILVFICLLLVIIVVLIDVKAQKQLDKIKRAWIKISADKEAVEEEIIEKPKFKFRDIKQFGAGFWLNCLSCML